MRILAYIILMMMFHPVHLTVTNVEYDKQSKAFLIKYRFFSDDLQKIIYIKYGEKPDFTDPKNKQTKELLHNYITGRFALYVDGQQIPSRSFDIKSYQLQDITLWVNVRVPYKQHFQNIKVINRLMTDLYNDQSNLLIFTYNSKQFALRFSKKHTTESLTF